MENAVSNHQFRFGVACLFAFSIAHGANFFERKEEGWFWYKDPPVAPAPKPEDPVPPKVVSATPAKKEAIPPFSVKWLQVNLEKLRVAAIDSPTDDNIRNYLYAQRVMMDKADNFAVAAARVARTDPFLDENNRFPFAAGFNSGVLLAQKGVKEEAMRYLSSKGGLWFFYDSRCGFCQMQASVVEEMGQKYGFKVMRASLDGKPLKDKKPFVVDRGQFKTFGLKLTPSIVMAIPPKGIYVVGQGALTIGELESRIMTAALNSKLLPADMQKKYDIFDRGLLKASDFEVEKGEEFDPDDPRQWVEFLRKQLDQRY